MIEGMLGAVEAKSYRLRCRFIEPANMRRFG